jgi:hypothetical protein
MVWQETVNLPTSVTTGSIPVISTKNVPASLDTLTQRMRSVMTHTGGSKAWNISLTVAILRSNLTGAGNARTVPVGKRVEGVCDA